MGKLSALTALARRKKAKAELASILSAQAQTVIVHYSCESFYDRKDGASPRITSIAVRNVENAQTKSFSIHQLAEVEHVNAAEIEADYDRLEKLMLDSFYDYVRQRQHWRWVHWNMRDINFGFPAIAHRYRVLKGTPVEIAETQLFDLARVLIAIYGPGYASHPRLESLMGMNKISARDFLVGAKEAEAFEKHEYVKLHQSTLRKVDIIANILSRVEGGTIKVNARGIDPILLYPRAFVETAKEHWMISVLLPVLGILAAMFDVMKMLRS